MKKTALIIMLLTIITKVLGFAREIILSYFYGASNITDAYLISTTIPGTIFAFIGAGIATSYIPIYSNVLKNDGEEYANKFTSNLISIILILCSFIVLTVLSFTGPIVKLFASGFDTETLKLAVAFTRIGIVSIYFSGLIFVIDGFLQIKGKFIPSIISGIPLSIVAILSIILSSQGNVMMLAIGNFCAILVQLLFLIPSIRKSGLRYSFNFRINDQYIKRMLLLSIPVIIGVSVNQINVLIDRTIASHLVVGGISAITYANRLNLFIQGIFVMSMATVFYPMISKMAAENEMKKLKATISEAITAISILVVPATVGSMVFSKEIVLILFGRGAFDQQAIEMTTSALFFFSLGMIGFGLREILTRAFYSLQDTKTPMVNAGIAVVLNIILNLILSRYLGLGGLALATSISGIFCTLLLFVNLRRKIGGFGIKQLSLSFMKILFASLLMGLVSRLSYLLLNGMLTTNLSLLISISIGFIIYTGLIILFKINDVEILIGTLKNKFKKYRLHKN